MLVAVGLAGLIGSTWAFAARPGIERPKAETWGSFVGAGTGSTCTAPTLPGQTLNIVLSDMGGMIEGGHMLNIAASPSVVAAGKVSFEVLNAGMMIHELVVLPLPQGGVGTRAVGSNGRVSEAGSLGEASRSCGEGAGDGIAPGAASWVTLDLAPGRYELICNLPGHYAMGMFTELDVR
jgi:Copper binding proteins, plastocyanin/azurin family.